MIDPTERQGDDAVNAPLVSVVMPAYNAEPYVAAAIESILDQTLTDLELIIVDDASTDATWEKIKTAAAIDGRIRAFRNEKNQGVTATTIAGIRLARAAVIARMDADDVSMPSRIESQLRLLEEHPHYSVIGTFAAHINDKGTRLSLSATGPSSEKEFLDLRARCETTMVFGGTALFRAETYEKAGGLDPGITTGEDVELFDRMADLGPVIAIPEPLVLYRLHEQSLVRNTFFEGRLVHRFVKARRMARATGETLTLERFREAQRARPWYRRAATYVHDRARYHYRESGMAFGNRRWVRFAGHLALAAVLNPRFVTQRLWSQRLSLAARNQSN